MSAKKSNYYPKPQTTNTHTSDTLSKPYSDKVHPEIAIYMGNVRFIVKQKYKTFTSFERALYEAKKIKFTQHIVNGYTSGYIKTIQFNYIDTIADFLGYNVHELLTCDLTKGIVTDSTGSTIVSEPVSTYSHKPGSQPTVKKKPLKQYPLGDIKVQSKQNNFHVDCSIVVKGKFSKGLNSKGIKKKGLKKYKTDSK